MSTSNPPPPGNPPPTPPVPPLQPHPAPATKGLADAPRREILIISHCSMFYWWPVWAVGFVMFLISMVEGNHMVVVPAGTTALKEQVKLAATEDDKKFAKQHNIPEGRDRDAYVLPLGMSIPPDPSDKNRAENPRLHMTSNKNLGVMFCAVLLLVIVITNVPLRGLWSVIVIVMIILIVILFALLEWWATILGWLSLLDIRINAAGYFTISLVLFILWLVIMLVFDRQIYMVFTPGQLRVRTEIGDAETAYDTTGMTVQKQRSDLFRHWILGIGSGDLIVKTSGATTHEFHMPNVLFIGRKVKEIEEMLRQRQIVTTKGPH